MWDRNEIQKATPTFVESSDPKELLWILYSQTGNGKFKMAATECEK